MSVTRPVGDTRHLRGLAADVRSAAEARQFFGDAWDRAAGRTHSADEIAHRVAAGWTVQAIEWIALLTRFALRSPARVAAIRRRDSNVPSHEQALFGRLDHLVQSWNGNPNVSLDEALAWLEVVATSPDPAESRRLYAMMQILDGRPWRESEFAAWQRAAPVRQATLAYSAGLTPAETEARRMAGTLDEASLRAMAALRGYRLFSSAEPRNPDA